MQSTLYVIGILLTLIGVVGTVIPALPGSPLVFGGLTLIAWGDRFQRVGLWPLVLIAVLMLAALAIDLIMTVYGAKRAGASRWAVLGAGLGLLLGLFLGPLGILIGPFVGAIVAEYIAQRDLDKATRAGVGAGLGVLIGSISRVVLVFSMIGVFLIAWFWN
jgi:uncharacterized protein YqgC (DUF456 family)